MPLLRKEWEGASEDDAESGNLTPSIHLPAPRGSGKEAKMSRFRNACILHAIVGCGFVTASACGDDVTYGPDAGPKSDATLDQVAPDGGSDASVGPRVLMTYAATAGELVAFGTGSKQVTGRLAMPGYGTVQRTNGETFVVESGVDTV